MSVLTKSHTNSTISKKFLEIASFDECGFAAFIRSESSRITSWKVSKGPQLTTHYIRFPSEFKDRVDKYRNRAEEETGKTVGMITFPRHCFRELVGRLL